MSDRPTALHKGVACASTPPEARSAESKQGQDTERSDVSACWYLMLVHKISNKSISNSDFKYFLQGVSIACYAEPGALY